MTKRRVICWLLVSLVLAAFAVWLDPTRVVWGWLRGEAFYQGRPTSWWAEQIRPWKICQSSFDVLAFTGDGLSPPLLVTNPITGAPFGVDADETQLQTIGILPHAHDDRLRSFIKRWVNLPDPVWPAIFEGDSEAQTVLRELLDTSDTHISNAARFGLRRLHSGERGAVVTVRARPSDVLEMELHGRR